MKLTQKQELFANYIFQDIPRTEAYIKAGYSSNMLPATITQNAMQFSEEKHQFILTTQNNNMDILLENRNKYLLIY